MDKNTDELMKILRSKPDIDSFLQENEDELLTQSLTDLLLEYLISKDLQISDVIRNTYLDRTYTYQIFEGKHKPSRDKLLCLAFGLHLTVEETQLLLKTAQLARLTPHIRRDLIILACLDNGININDCYHILEDHGELPLQ